MRHERPDNPPQDHDAPDAEAPDGRFLCGHLFSVCGGGDVNREGALGIARSDRRHDNRKSRRCRDDSLENP